MPRKEDTSWDRLRVDWHYVLPSEKLAQWGRINRPNLSMAAQKQTSAAQSTNPLYTLKYFYSFFGRIFQIYCFPFFGLSGPVRELVLSYRSPRHRYSERKKRKSPFTTTPLSFDAPSPANLREYPHKSYLAINKDPWATILSLTVMCSTSNFRTVLSESQKRQLIICRARNRF